MATKPESSRRKRKPKTKIQEAQEAAALRRQLDEQTRETLKGQPTMSAISDEDYDEMDPEGPVKDAEAELKAATKAHDNATDPAGRARAAIRKQDAELKLLRAKRDAAAKKNDDRDEDDATPAAGLPTPEEEIRSSSKVPTSPSLYGVRAEGLKARRAAQTKKVADKLAKERRPVVFMGQKDETQTVPMNRWERQNVKIKADVIADGEMLKSWIIEPDRLEFIQEQARKAGMDIETHEDLEKVWYKALQLAAQSFAAGKKITPWAAMAMMGRGMGPDGKPKKKTGTDITVEEMDPAEARLLIERAASDALGRAPTKAEVDDFISRAQLIAKDNPKVSTWSQEVGFDGEEVEDSRSITSTKGGAGAVNAQAQVAAMDMARQDDEYAEYQAAGVLMPALMDALQSPV